jgi:holliday junction DNA helicase RuvA
MFHIYSGYISHYESQTYIENDIGGIEVVYEGKQEKGKFFLIPQIDQHSGFIKYFAFDTPIQKAMFQTMTKIQGIGGRSGYTLAMRNHAELDTAIESFDIGYFQSIPGIGPKTAKRILVELKTELAKRDTEKLQQDDSVGRDIVASLKALGYDAKKVKQLLSEYPDQLQKEQLPVIMQWVIERI